jgi:enoyl-CoA hydratase
MLIELSRHEEFAIIRINRVSASNALNQAMLSAIEKALDQVEASDARVLLVTGAGEKAFCAGADISEILERSLPEEYAGPRLGQALCLRIERFRLPSVAVVNGHALGGGCELAMACTFRVAAPNATFGLPEIKLGLMPGFGGTQRLPRLVGLGTALEMLMSGRSVSADEALRMGLLNRVFDGELLPQAMAYARTFSRHGLFALRLVRDAATRGSDTSLEEGLKIEADLSVLSLRSEDGKEGPRAFLEKRAAIFIDR